MTNESQSQPYDSALKSLVDEHAAEMIPEILPDSLFISELNAEIARTNLRPDLVYQIQRKGKPHILNLELQTDKDSDMAYRMLVYHVELYGKHRLPVISMVIYPFETSIPEPVFREEGADEILLEFEHRVLRLWTLEAAPYLEKRVVSMYTLLPGMKGVTAPMLIQAIGEMKQRYQGEQLSRHLVRFRTILRRSKTLSAQDKQIVEGEMPTYDSLLESDPELQEYLARTRIDERQRSIVSIVEARFPNLIDWAREQVVRQNDLSKLDLLMKQIASAPDEATARWALSTATD